MKKFYEKYRDVIIGILVFLFAFKSCQYNNSKRFIEVNNDKVKMELVSKDGIIDSLNNEMRRLELEIAQKDTIINNYKVQLDILNTHSKYYMDANKELIKIQRLNKIDK